MSQVDLFLRLVKEAKNSSTLPIDYIQIIEYELNDYFDKINKYKSTLEADFILTELGLFQEKLAELSFRYNIILSKKLNDFIREFDRSDDQSVRNNLFDKIKSTWPW